MNIFIIVGLGNPGDEYKLTRHNIGFNVIDELREDFSVDSEKFKFSALISEVVVDNNKLVFVKPQTYMNSSGDSVSQVCNWYKISLDRLIVVYDDIDIEWGKLRIRPTGSAGSHNGLKSVIASIKSQAFPRVRVGIGKPPVGWDLANYVLGRFSEDEQKLLGQIVDNAKRAVKSIIEIGVDRTMNLFNVSTDKFPSLKVSEGGG